VDPACQAICGFRVAPPSGAYPAIARAVSSLGARQTYLDGELCGVFPDGITSFGMIQAASDAGNAAGLVYFIFDLLHLDGEDVAALPLIERKARLADLLSDVRPPLHYSDYHRGRGPAFHAQGLQPRARGHRLETRRCRLCARQSQHLGSKSNASTARNLSWSAGPIPKARGRGSARCCSPITIPTGGWSMPPRRRRHQQAELEGLWHRL
jgi:hypothetical protein